MGSVATMRGGALLTAVASILLEAIISRVFDLEMIQKPPSKKK